MNDAFNLKKSPHLILMMGSIGLLVLLVFRRAFRLNLDGSELFGLPLNDMIWALPLFLQTIYFLYTVTNKVLISRIAVWMHVLITVILTYILMAAVLIGLTRSSDLPMDPDTLGWWFRVLVWVLLSVQIIYIGNFALGLLGIRRAV